MCMQSGNGNGDPMPEALADIVTSGVQVMDSRRCAAAGTPASIG
jgi:hypothetical protein